MISLYDYGEVILGKFYLYNLVKRNKGMTMIKYGSTTTSFGL